MIKVSKPGMKLAKPLASTSLATVVPDGPGPKQRNGAINTARCFAPSPVKCSILRRDPAVFVIDRFAVFPFSLIDHVPIIGIRLAPAMSDTIGPLPIIAQVSVGIILFAIAMARAVSPLAFISAPRYDSRQSPDRLVFPSLSSPSYWHSFRVLSTIRTFSAIAYPSLLVPLYSRMGYFYNKYFSSLINHHLFLNQAKLPVRRYGEIFDALIG